MGVGVTLRVDLTRKGSSDVWGRVQWCMAVLSTWMSTEFHEEHNGVFIFQIQANSYLAEYIKIKKKAEKR